jgi:hypothetical protein
METIMAKTPATKHDTTKLIEEPDRKAERKPTSKADENSQLFADLLQYRMLSREKASLRESRVVDGWREFEFTNGDTVSGEASVIEKLGSLAELDQYITERFDARTRP